MNAELLEAVEERVNHLRAAVCKTDDERAVFDWALSLGGRYTRPDEMLLKFVREIDIQSGHGREPWSIEDQLIFFLSNQLPEIYDYLKPEEATLISAAETVTDRIQVRMQGRSLTAALERSH
jgi:hypothetical protein